MTARVLDAGINFIDTAEMYAIPPRAETMGSTERIIGRWLQQRGCRDRLVLATKVAGPMGGGPNDLGLSRKHILDAVEARGAFGAVEGLEGRAAADQEDRQDPRQESHPPPPWDHRGPACRIEL